MVSNKKVNHPDTQNGIRALAAPTQRDILKRLAKGDHSIAQLTQHFDITLVIVKKHLTVLSDDGFITTRAAGRERFNALNPDGFAPMRDWIGFFNHFWDTQLSNLKDAIGNNNQKDQYND